MSEYYLGPGERRPRDGPRKGAEGFALERPSPRRGCLLPSPLRSGSFGDVEVEDAPAVVAKDDEDEKGMECRRGDGEEVDRDQILEMIVQKRAPGLRGWPTRSRHVLGDLSFARSRSLV